MAASTSAASRRSLAAEAAEVRFVRIHGHQVAYRSAGSGPVILLVHGIAGSSGTWARVMPALAEHHTVIALDMLGHGASAKPRGDYSLGAYASGIRDLMVALGHESATIVGHSLGGGVAMQFAYQFPERCDRLVLVASGGLGKEVNVLLRVVSGPGSEYVLPIVLTRGLHGVIGKVSGVLNRVGLQQDPLLEEVWASLHRAHRRPGPTGLRAHDPLGHRRVRPAGERTRPALPRRRGADPHRVGRP